MKKTLLIASIMFLLFSPAIGQKTISNHYEIKVDTLQINADSVFARIMTFKNDTLLEEGTCVLIPDKIYKSDKHRLKKPNNFVAAERIIWNGNKTRFGKEGTKQTTVYHYGKPIMTTYFQNNLEITDSLFNSKNDNIRGPCGSSVIEYIIQGEKKK